MNPPPATGPRLWWTTLPDGAQIAVPDDLRLLSRWVLEEQGDWFEDEIRFVRRWFPIGGAAVDVGANYGSYSLSLAARGGPSSRIVAFEPTSSVAGCLAQSIKRNRFEHLELVPKAVSESAGRAWLRHSANSELNELSAAGGGPGEFVETIPIDDWHRGSGSTRIDFLKIDAEGHELAVLAGARRVLEEASPLVMAELRHGDAVNVALADALRSRGFAIHRLMPGPMVLVPFELDGEIEPFQLNLLACRPDRSAELRSAGFLVDQPAKILPSAPTELVRSWVALHGELPDPADWREIPEQLLQAMAEHVASLHRDAGPEERVARSSEALRLAEQASEAPLAPAALASCAVIAWHAGARELGVRFAGRAAQLLATSPDRPHVVPSLLRGVRPDGSPADLLGFRTAVISAWECRRSWSTYFSGIAAIQPLRISRALGRSTPEIDRRLELVSRVQAR